MLARVKSWAQKKINSQITARNFYSYEDIPLKRYLSIIQTGNIYLLAKRKVFVSKATFIHLWEEIIKKNSVENGDFTYDYYHDLEEDYGALLSDYTAVKATISKLTIRVDQEDIDFLAEAGFPLKKFSNTAEYFKALELVSQRVESLVTRMMMNRKEEKQLTSPEDVPVNTFPTLDKLIGDISVDLPFEVKDDVTLARYNQYKKYVENKRKPKPIEDGRD